MEHSVNTFYQFFYINITMSILSVNEMIAQINKHYPTKAHLYEVRIFGASEQPDAQQDLMINCSSVNVPGSNMQYVAKRKYTLGVFHNIPVNKSFTEINMSFYETEYERERQYFIDWQNKIFDPVTERFGFYNDYVKTINIIQYDKKGNRTYECELTDAYPSNISPLDRAYSQDGIAQFNINFQYHKVNEKFFDRVNGFNPFSIL